MAHAVPLGTAARRLPPSLYFLVSSIFHYLGPSFAVLLFARVSVPGVAWLRIASAAAIFAAWRRPWRSVLRLDSRELGAIAVLGIIIAAMNLSFYLAVARLPLSTVGAIEFLGPVALAAYGLRSARNVAALALAVIGVVIVTRIRLGGEPIGFAFTFANAALFLLYVVLGHRIAARKNIDNLAAAMLVALVVVTPFGLSGAVPAISNLQLLAAGLGVGLTSSVIPYVTDQLAMARLPRATFALMLSLLPIFAVTIGALVLRQIPTFQDAAGIAFVVAGVALHRQETS